MNNVQRLNIKAARNQRKRKPFKTGNSVKLDSSRMKKNDPTLLTWDTLMIRVQNERVYDANNAHRQYTIEFETREGDPSLMIAL